MPVACRTSCFQWASSLWVEVLTQLQQSETAWAKLSVPSRRLWKPPPLTAFIGLAICLSCITYLQWRIASIWQSVSHCSAGFRCQDAQDRYASPWRQWFLEAECIARRFPNHICGYKKSAWWNLQVDQSHCAQKQTQPQQLSAASFDSRPVSSWTNFTLKTLAPSVRKKRLCLMSCVRMCECLQEGAIWYDLDKTESNGEPRRPWDIIRTSPLSSWSLRSISKDLKHWDWEVSDQGSAGTLTPSWPLLEFLCALQYHLPTVRSHSFQFPKPRKLHPSVQCCSSAELLTPASKEAYWKLARCQAELS